MRTLKLNFGNLRISGGSRQWIVNPPRVGSIPIIHPSIRGGLEAMEFEDVLIFWRRST
jgi:hypothetical protein